MALNEKNKKLVELLAKRRAVAIGVGTSNPPPPATFAPNSSAPALMAIAYNGWWWLLVHVPPW